MEYTNSLSHSFTNRMQNHYNEINENIDKLIDDLGLKVQKQMINIEERTLLKYKDNLLQAQNNFKDLKELRNDEAIKQNILNMKIEQEKVYQESTDKSLEMNKVYDKLKVQFKQAVEYSHELELELKFLGKQCKIAKTKSESLDQEIKEFEDRKNKETIQSLQKSQSNKKFSREFSKQEATVYSQVQSSLYQKRLKDKIQNLKQFMSFMNDQESTMESLFSKYKFQFLKTQREKASYFQQIFEDKEFKRFIFKILFGGREKCKESNSLKK